MHKRCVDVARCIGSADPYAHHLAFRAATIPSVALGDVENAFFDRRPDSTAAIAECRIAVKKRERSRDDAFGNKAIHFAVRSASVVCSELNHFSGGVIVRQKQPCAPHPRLNRATSFSRAWMRYMSNE